MARRRYIPALRFDALTRFYDPLMGGLMPERAIKSLALGLLAAGALVSCAHGQLPSTEAAVPSDASGDPGEGSSLASPLPRPPSGEGALAAELASDGERLYLSWLERADEVYAFRWATWDGASWSAPATVVESEALFGNPFDRPGLHPLRDGQVLAHWLAKSGAETYAYDILIASSADGGQTWSTPQPLHDDRSPLEHGFPSVVPLTNGGAQLFWLDGRTSPSDEDYRTTVWTRTLRGGVLGAEQIVDPLACDCCATAATLLDGAPVVAYRDRTEGEIRDIAVARVGISGPGESRRVHDDGWEIAGCPVNGPSVDTFDGRSAVVAWPTFAQDDPRIQVAWIEGDTISPPQQIGLGSPLGRVDVVALGPTEALVSWVEGGDGGPTLRTSVVARDPGSAEARARTGSLPSLAASVPRLERVGTAIFLAWVTPDGIQVVQLKHSNNVEGQEETP